MEISWQSFRVTCGFFAKQDSVPIALNSQNNLLINSPVYPIILRFVCCFLVSYSFIMLYIYFLFLICIPFRSSLSSSVYQANVVFVVVDVAIVIGDFAVFACNTRLCCRCRRRRRRCCCYRCCCYFLVCPKRSTEIAIHTFFFVREPLMIFSLVFTLVLCRKRQPIYLGKSTDDVQGLNNLNLFRPCTSSVLFPK